jgi:hypothetical protein
VLTLVTGCNAGFNGTHTCVLESLSGLVHGCGLGVGLGMKVYGHAVMCVCGQRVTCKQQLGLSCAWMLVSKANCNLSVSAPQDVALLWLTAHCPKQWCVQLCALCHGLLLEVELSLSACLVLETVMASSFVDKCVLQMCLLASTERPQPMGTCCGGLQLPCKVLPRSYLQYFAGLRGPVDLNSFPILLYYRVSAGLQGWSISHHPQGWFSADTLFGVWL